MFRYFLPAFLCFFPGASGDFERTHSLDTGWVVEMAGCLITSQKCLKIVILLIFFHQPRKKGVARFVVLLWFLFLWPTKTRCDGLRRWYLEEMFHLWMFVDVNAEFSSHMSINSVAIPCSLLYLLDLIFNTSICGHKKHSKGFERITAWSKLVVQIQELLVYHGSLLQHFSGVASHLIWPRPILQSLFCLRKCQGDWLPIRHQGQTYELMAGSQGKKENIPGANWGKWVYQGKRESQRMQPDLAMLIAYIHIRIYIYLI